MLESTLQQLAGADRECKVDAYTMLFRGLKTSSNLPDRIALQNKMTVFMQFIQRDLTARMPNGSVDNLLVTSALKLLHTFLHFHGIASSISYDFGVFMVDHSIRTFEDEQASKEVVKHLMQALFLQNFPPEVMAIDRVGRLVSALHNIENHLTGKSIVQSRIVVYEKLVKQCSQQMTVHSDWLQDLFTDMLSSISDIRSAAIKLGLSAAFTLNKDRRFVSRVVELLNLSLEDKKYVEEFSERLRVMLQNPQQSTSVPRIWSVVTLFIPKPHQWDYFNSWSRIIQLSFNNSNPQVKREANLAWNRFTYRLHLDGRLVHNLIRDPLLSLLKRKGLRDSVLASVCNFYYYAFKPDMNLRMLDETWNLAVAPLMQGLIEQGQEEATAINQASAILTGLIDCQTRRVWREDRITDQSPIKADELPAIESKWIRANSARVFALVAPILEKGFVEVSRPDSQLRKLWKALVHSVASASTKDVKLHDDTAKFVARSGDSLGLEFRDLVKVLERGLRDETGDAGVAIVLVEPLAAALSEKISDENSDIVLTNCIGVAIELVAASTQPRDKQAADAARRRLWGTSNAGNRLPSFDPLDNMYKLFVILSKKLYADVELHASGPIEQLLDETKYFFDRGNRQLFLRTLNAVQGGLTYWLEDKDRRITRAEFPSVVDAVRVS
ncbi:putative telomere length regulator protein [Diaporthe ampelina]|uniref:Putative telomere length regulator protein n=1 Tax=Diaporthe ampelina TaxID=1214573 RepID=A0A0G2FU71_9PEZI|nr:putative telomere length regulator protein [Diaporthe ampelina]